MGGTGRRGRTLRRGLVALVLVIGVVVGLFWTLQRQLIYVPDTADPGPVARLVAGGQDLTLRTSDGLELSSWLVPDAEGTDTRYAVLLAPGNGGNPGVVAELAERHRPAAVVLRSPYTVFADVASTHYPWLPIRMLLRDDFDVVGPLSRTDVPVTVVYGTADTIVPPRLSERVSREVAVLAEEVVLEGVGHNDPEMFGAPVADAVARAVGRAGHGAG
ncbi:hypothetical protein [Ornithinimicrobium panacihumi]|uniref:hypothetical protein n=1 Tax=Ornithinimicrobium panacihumi TaxID=2008449 RepID=UPI003F8A8899